MSLHLGSNAWNANNNEFLHFSACNLSEDMNGLKGFHRNQKRKIAEISWSWKSGETHDVNGCQKWCFRTRVSTNFPNHDLHCEKYSFSFQTKIFGINLVPWNRGRISCDVFTYWNERGSLFALWQFENQNILSMDFQLNFIYSILSSWKH